MAPLDLARLANMDFIDSLTGNRLAFGLLQSPELVELNNVKYIVTRDTWGLAGPDPRDFSERLIDFFKFTGNLFYQDVKKAAYQADRIVLHLPKKFFNEAPVSQEKAWSAWLLADAARQVIKDDDDQNIHVKLPALSAVTALFLRKGHMANILLEREQTLVDALLLRFRSITELAPLPEGNEIKEVTAAQTFQLKVETAGLIRAAEDLMSLTRELKEMWLFGPLRSLNEGEARVNAQIDEDARAVANLIDHLAKKDDGKEKPTDEKENEKHAANCMED